MAVLCEVSCMRSGWMAVVMLAPVLALADSITIGGETFDNVLVRQSDSLYYVQKPQDGSVLSVPKSNARDVFLSQNPAERELLLHEWKKMNAVLTGISGDMPAGAAGMQGMSMPGTGMSMPTGLSMPDAAGAGADATAAMRKRASDAMKAAKKKQEQEMEAMSEYESVQLARPAGGRQPSAADIQKRMQEMTGSGNESPAAAYMRQAASARNNAAGANGAGGMGGMGMAPGLGRTDGYGGMGGGVNGYGMQGAMGSAGMGGFGGFGGFGGGFGMGGQTFSNISDLFSTIDDGLVGETPAIIGMQR